MSSEEPNFSFKIVLTGNSGVGKTNFLSRFSNNQFNNETKPTIGVQFASETLEIKGKSIKAQIWDTSGQEKFNTITTAYYRDAIGAILFYDITDQESFDSISHWLQTLRKEADDKCVLMLVGNKCDLTDKRKVSTEQGEDYAKRENLLFIEASALDSTNVKEAFNNLFSEIVDRLTSQKEKKEKKESNIQEIEINENSNSQNKIENQNEQQVDDKQEDDQQETEIQNEQQQENKQETENKIEQEEESNESIKETEKQNQENNQDESSQLDHNEGSVNSPSEMVHILIEKEKIAEVIQYVRDLEGKLGKYEEVNSFDFQAFMSSIVDENDIKPSVQKETKDETKETKQTEQTELKQSNEKEEKTSEIKNDKIFINEEDEKFQEVQKQIGEGASSITYKVVDTRNSHVMCKKILKTKDASSNSTDSLVKEFKELHQIQHPCICRLISINPNEKVSSESINETNENKTVNEEEEYYEAVISKPKKNQDSRTLISLFTEYLDFGLKSCLENDILTNTLKVKVALEVAFGMAHLHKLGLIHRDLRIDNIMLNSGFEAKIINFGLIHHGIDEMLSRDIGTLTYMSPEMQNEDEYDNKTDVYSYGVVLYAVFTGKLPKQKMKDKLNKVPPHFPKPSSTISNVCIELIKNCMSFDANERPSFVKIIEYMNQNSFALADEVDFEIISRRYHELIGLIEQ